MIARLIKYGGVCGKIHALYGNRLTQEDMERLSRMSDVTEITAFLKNHPGWEASLRPMTIEGIHRGSLEDRLRNQLFIEFRKIMRFLKMRDKQLMHYINRAELDQLLLFLRYLKAGRPQDYIYAPPEGFERYSKIDFGALSGCSTYVAFLEAVRHSEFYKPLISVAPAPGDAMPDYTELETVLESYFYNAFIAAVDKLYKGGVRKQLRKTIGAEIDVINITRAIRVRRYYPGLRDELFSYLIPIFHRFKRQYLADIANAPDDDAEKALLRSGPYGKVFADKDITSVEDYYNGVLLRYNYKSMHGGIPAIYAPIAYLSLKSAELRNLISTIERVRYRVARDFVV